MSNNQVKLLGELARKIKSEPKDSRGIIDSLAKAKILTRNGNFTNHFSHLKKAVTTAK